MLHQNLTQGQHLKIFPQQLQMLQLFHLNTLELDQRIRNELEENPLIEEVKEPEDTNEHEKAEDVQDYKDWEEYAYDDNYVNRSRQSGHDVLLTKFCAEDFNANDPADFRNEALEQLHILNLSPEEFHIGEFIIRNLTNEGFLDETIDDLVDEYMLRYTRFVSTESMESMVNLIRTFEPAGLASSGIRACLLAQLKQMDRKKREVDLCETILSEYYELLKSRNFEKLAEDLQIESRDLHELLLFLGRLKLKPIESDPGEAVRLQTIVPDFIVTHYDGFLRVSLFREKASSIRISPGARGGIKYAEKNRRDRAVSREMSRRLNAAEWFVNAIRERECVMLRVMQSIVDIQYNYFLTGDEMQLRPMILKEVAEKAGADISTVSRITSNKYVQMPFGCVLLKELFNEGIASTDGNMVNVKKVQETIQKVIKLEDKCRPYTDAQIAALLSNRGLKISRRTVTKYRNEIKIPSVKQRVNGISF